MFRFLIAFGAVCLFSIASAGVAEAGGGGGGAGGGKGGGKNGSIEITNSGSESIAVFYRAEEVDFPATAGELDAEFERIDIAAGSTGTISGLNEGTFDLLVASTSDADSTLEFDPEFALPGREETLSIITVPVMADATTGVLVMDGLGISGLNFSSDVTVTENEN